MRFRLHGVQRWLGRGRLEVLVDNALIDSMPPEDVEPLARYLYAMCWPRPRPSDNDEWEEWAEFSLAATMWLVYGVLDAAAFPLGSVPLDKEGRAGLPLPYRDRPEPVEVPRDVVD